MCAATTDAASATASAAGAAAAFGIYIGWGEGKRHLCISRNPLVLVASATAAAAPDAAPAAVFYLLWDPCNMLMYRRDYLGFFSCGVFY